VLASFVFGEEEIEINISLRKDEHFELGIHIV
jgi:hypothetical protein